MDDASMMGNGKALNEDEASGIAGSCGTTFTFFTPMLNSVRILPSFSFLLSFYILFAFTFAHMLTEASWPRSPYIDVFTTLGAACGRCYIIFDLIC